MAEGLYILIKSFPSLDKEASLNKSSVTLCTTNDKFKIDQNVALKLFSRKTFCFSSKFFFYFNQLIFIRVVSHPQCQPQILLFFSTTTENRQSSKDGMLSMSPILET